MWIAGPPERAGAGYVWGTLGKNEGRGYGVEGGRASEASHLESPGIWRALASGEPWHLESRSRVGPGRAELW